MEPTVSEEVAHSGSDPSILIEPRRWGLALIIPFPARNILPKSPQVAEAALCYMKGADETLSECVLLTWAELSWIPTHQAHGVAKPSPVKLRGVAKPFPGLNANFNSPCRSYQLPPLG